MLDAIIYLTAAVICVPLSKKFKLGSVLGYLLAGILIGPWGFKLVKDADTILHFSELGVVLMLFLIGLELEPKRLWSMRATVIGGGSVQLGLCGVALATASYSWGLNLTAAIVVGIALALSSTAIAMQTMHERNLISTPTGRQAFSILLFQDIAAIPLLAILPQLNPHIDHSFEWKDIGFAVSAILLVIASGQFLLRPVLRLIAGIQLREIFTAFALLLVLSISFLMQNVGLSMGLGAFLAGVLLASSEYRHALETDIEPFKGLLMGLFFIAIGMTIDFSLIIKTPLLVFSAVVGFTLIKAIMLYLCARIVGVASLQRSLFTALIAQGGEFAFVVFTSALQAQVLNSKTVALLNLTVALSMATTPFLVILIETIQAQRLKMRKIETVSIEEQDAPIIIAGFGRLGQVVGRLLFANGLRATVLDHDPEQIELLRKFGFHVFYGDATRLDLLHAAGAEHAKIIINAIDDQGDNLKLVDLVNQHFPHIKIIARARNVSHYLELKSRNVDTIERETFEAALRIGRSALEEMGIDRFLAREMADRFRRMNIQSLEEIMPYLQDETRRLSMAKAAREELEELFKRDIERLDKHRQSGW